MAWREFGIRLCYHPHAATYIEAPHEVDRLMTLTDPALIKLGPDTGHLSLGGGDPIAIVDLYFSRLGGVHLKDIDLEVAEQARRQRLDYRQTCGRGVWTELGTGSVDFPGFFALLRKKEWSGWAIVETDHTRLETALDSSRVSRTLGIKMADPGREVYAMVGDGSYLMLSSEITTSIQEGLKLIIVLLDNHGFGSIGGLSRSLGSSGFGTSYRYRDEAGQLEGDLLPLDFAANAESLGARSLRVTTIPELREALETARQEERTTVIVLEVDKEMGVPGYESWWDVPVAEVSEMDSVRKVRKDYEEKRDKERFFL